MRIKELFEATLTDDFDSMIARIKSECQPYLKQSEGRLLFRGMRHKGEYERLSVRQDRRPKNIPRDLHDKMDAWFESEFGFKARSTTVFATGELVDARSYGPAYAIFPIGDFKFLWSADVFDLFTLIDDDQSEADELDSLGYTDKNLVDAIKSKNEVMIQCKEYYAMRVSSTDEANHIKDVLKD